MILSGKTYTASAGETFDSVAVWVYGDEKYAVDLMQANPKLVTRAVLSGGEELALPVLTVAETVTEAAVGDTAPWRN